VLGDGKVQIKILVMVDIRQRNIELKNRGLKRHETTS
jgi:hypothetical protein